MSSTLTTAKLDAALAKMGIESRPARACYVVNSAVMAEIRKLPAASPPEFMGLPVHEKPDQRADCYAFKKQAWADDYLAGRITETDLNLYLAIKATAGYGTLEDFLAAKLGT